MIIKGYRVGPLLKITGKEILNDNVLGLAAQAAYNAFFSIFPFFLFAAPLLSLFGDKQKTFSWLMNQPSRVDLRTSGGAWGSMRVQVCQLFARCWAAVSPGFPALRVHCSAWRQPSAAASPCRCCSN